MRSAVRSGGACGIALLAIAAATGCGGGSDTTGTAATAADTTATVATGPTVAAKTCGSVQYGGQGKPDALIVSDLPLRGDSAERSRQQVEAIRLVLAQRGWKAGSTTVGFISCDDSIAKTGLWDEATCRANAAAYAANPKVLGVIGTYNSGCAALEVPILNRASVAMISPGNTDICLTESSPSCTSGQPQSLYPSGTRNYARVVPNDAFQGAALAQFAAGQGIKQPYILYAADDPTSTGQAQDFRRAAKSIGLKEAGFETWDPKAKSYSKLFGKVKGSGADGVVLAGLIEQNGAGVIRDKVAVLGPNSKLPLIAFDGFSQQTTIDDAGSASAGMFASVPGSAPESLPPKGLALVSSLKKEVNGQPIEQFAPYAGEAAAVMLDSIAKGGANRAGTVRAIFATKGGSGILHKYDIDPSGDPSVGPVTVLRAASSFVPFKVVTPKPSVVRAARG